MNRLRPSRWTIAFLLALAAHLAVLLYATAGLDTEPAWRGGGETGGGDGVVVRLGAPAGTDGAPESQAAAEAAPAPPSPPAPQTPPPQAAAELVPERPVHAVPVPAPEPAPAVPAIAVDPAPQIAAAPVPKPAAKPERPKPRPPAETPRPPPPAAAPAAAPPPVPEKPPAESAAEAVKRQTAVSSGVVFGSESSRLGTASGEAEGRVRDLTYGDRVMLWLQRHGEYPLPAARYGLKDTVTVEFAINRRGVILYYRLVEESKWYMLNTAVRQMMDRSSPVPPIPGDIPDSELTFTVPVRFSPP